MNSELNEKDILKGNISDIKSRIKKLKNIDYDKLIEEEGKGKNRKTLIEWLNSEKEKKGIEKKKEELKREIPIEKIKFYGKRKLTSEEKRLFRKRILEKKTKPRFMRQEFTKLKRLKDVWRKPRGIDSKQAEEKRGKPKTPKIGYKKTKKIRNLHPSGFYPIRVHNIVELKKIDPKKEAVIIASSVGRKKRNEIIRIANKEGITILNPRKGEIMSIKSNNDAK